MNSTKLRIIIIDDELKDQKLVRKLIREKYGPAAIVGLAGDFTIAQQLILTTNPNLVILNTRLLQFSGFDLLNSIPNQKRDFQVIFTSNTIDYAVDAINSNAVGYLLKPIIPSELISAIEKARINISKDAELKWLKSLFETPVRSEHNTKKIMIPLLNRRKINIRIKDIIRGESQGDVTLVYLASNQKKKITANLGISEFETLLKGHDFFRIHKQHIVNFDFIENDPEFGGSLNLIDGNKIPIARRRKKEFVRKYDTYVSIIV